MTQTLAKAPELSVTVKHRSPRLVLDPRLCLSPAGPLLVERLQDEAELWLPRELWRILDNSHYFSLRPEALFDDRAASAGTPEYELTLRHDLAGCPEETAPSAHAEPNPEARELPHTLEAWDSIRMSNDLLGLRLFWLGDGLAESLVPPETRDDLHPRFELLAEQLDALLAPLSPITCGQRDILALSAALGGTPILSVLEAGTERPGLCSFAAAGLTVTEIERSDDCALLEREQYRSLLVRSQCAPLLWSALQLAIFHLHAPGAHRSSAPATASAGSLPATLRQSRAFADAALYWYRL